MAGSRSTSKAKRGKKALNQSQRLEEVEREPSPSNRSGFTSPTCYPKNLEGLKDLLRNDSPEARQYIEYLETQGKEKLYEFLRKVVRVYDADPAWGQDPKHQDESGSGESSPNLAGSDLNTPDLESDGLENPSFGGWRPDSDSDELEGANSSPSFKAKEKDELVSTDLVEPLSSAELVNTSPSTFLSAAGRKAINDSKQKQLMVVVDNFELEHQDSREPAAARDETKLKPTAVAEESINNKMENEEEVSSVADDAGVT